MYHADPWSSLDDADQDICPPWCSGSLLHKPEPARALTTIDGEWGGRWSWNKRQPLGRPGGFGDVYAGSGTENEAVAVKVIRGPGAGGNAPVQLRHREVQIAEKLRSVASDHLIPILDVASWQGNFVIVMPRADETLQDRLAVPMLPGEAIGVLVDVALGLRDLHSVGILHRDLKPGNVLRWRQTWRLADLGMGRDVGLGRGAFTFAECGGTAHYMAPEVVRGQSPSAQTDLYSLGCVAYELLAGHTPFSHVKSEEDVLHHHLQHRPPSIRDIDKTLAELVSDLLQKHRELRPSSAAEVVDRLRLLQPYGRDHLGGEQASLF